MAARAALNPAGRPVALGSFAWQATSAAPDFQTDPQHPCRRRQERYCWKQRCMHPARSVGVKAGALGFMLHIGGQATWQAPCCDRQALASGAAQRDAGSA